jgi:hypothetical protein
MRRHDQLILSAIREQRAGRPGTSTRQLAALQTQLATDIEVLNYALTLEHLEAAFYQMTGDYDLGTDPFGNAINDWLTQAWRSPAPSLPRARHRPWSSPRAPAPSWAASGRCFRRSRC